MKYNDYLLPENFPAKVAVAIMEWLENNTDVGDWDEKVWADTNAQIEEIVTGHMAMPDDFEDVE